MNFDELMATNPPRMVVLYRRSEGGEDQFQWGVVGGIPVLSLIGGIVRAQKCLVGGEWAPECSEMACVIAVDSDGDLCCFVHPSIPTDPLVGMLETIKVSLVGSRLAQAAVSQQTRILGPDGGPMRR